MLSANTGSSSGGRGRGGSRSFSLSTLSLDEQERQDDIVQHVHPRRLYLEFRLSSLGEVVRAVELGEYGLLLVGGDQLGTVIGRNISTEVSRGVNGTIPWDSSSP